MSKKIFFSCIVLFLLFWGLINAFVGHVPEGLAYISIGLAFLSIYIAFLSVEISKRSEVIANKSDRRVKDIANANFLRVLSIFEDRRIDLQHPEVGYLKHRVLIWKALVDMNEAEELLEEDLPKVITLALLPDRFEIMVEGIEDIITIPQLSAGTYDYFTLDENISRLKRGNENQGTIDLLPDPSVKFDTLLRSIDICKSNNFPNIKYLTSATKFYKAK